MGMYDTFMVEPGNKIGIPTPKHGDYQSKDHGCTLARFMIDVNGKIHYHPGTKNHLGLSMDLTNEAVLAVKAGRFNSTDLNIYSEDLDNKWRELTLVVENNQIIMVKEYDEILYPFPEKEESTLLA